MTRDPGLDPALVSEALLVWVPVIDGRRHPSGAEALVERYGVELALHLVPVVAALVREFNESDAHLAVAGLAEMGDLAAATFRAAHPEIAEAAVQRLANSYTFGFR